MKYYGYSKASIQSHQNYTNELNDLYDFISILPDEPITDIYKEINRLRDILARVDEDGYIEALTMKNLEREVSKLQESIHNHYRGSEKIVIENVALKKRVAELEESCENMNEVEKNLHEQIKTTDIRYKTQSSLTEGDINELKSVNLAIWEDNRRLKLLNKRSYRKIKILKNKLKNKIKGDC